MDLDYQVEDAVEREKMDEILVIYMTCACFLVGKLPKKKWLQWIDSDGPNWLPILSKQVALIHASIDFNYAVTFKKSKIRSLGC